MKKLILAVACVAFVASMTSCKKDCTCTDKTGTIPAQVHEGLSKDDCEKLNTAGAGIIICKQ